MPIHNRHGVLVAYAGRAVREAFDAMRDACTPGITTQALDDIGARILAKHRAVSAPSRFERACPLTPGCIEPKPEGGSRYVDRTARLDRLRHLQSNRSDPIPGMRTPSTRISIHICRVASHEVWLRGESRCRR